MIDFIERLFDWFVNAALDFYDQFPGLTNLLLLGFLLGMAAFLDENKGTPANTDKTSIEDIKSIIDNDLIKGDGLQSRKEVENYRSKDS